MLFLTKAMTQIGNLLRHSLHFPLPFLPVAWTHVLWALCPISNNASFLKTYCTKTICHKKRKRFTEMTAGAGCQGSWQCSRHIPHSRDKLLGSQGCRRCLLPCASFHRRLKKGKGKWVVEQRSNIASKHADIHFILVKTHIQCNQKKIWGPIQMEGVPGVSLLITFSSCEL